MTTHRAIAVRDAGTWGSQPDGPSVTLEHDLRHRRRIALTTDQGVVFLLDLPEARHLRHGDGLMLDDGRMILVCAKPEPVLEITARDPVHLACIAWHLGNRHLPAAIGTSAILIRPDHVIEEMVRGLGGMVRTIERPFDPETGAYALQGHGSAGRHDHH